MKSSSPLLIVAIELQENSQRDASTFHLIAGKILKYFVEKQQLNQFISSISHSFVAMSYVLNIWKIDKVSWLILLPVISKLFEKLIN